MGVLAPIGGLVRQANPGLVWCMGIEGAVFAPLILNDLIAGTNEDPGGPSNAAIALGAVGAGAGAIFPAGICRRTARGPLPSMRCW